MTDTTTNDDRLAYARKRDAAIKHVRTYHAAGGFATDEAGHRISRDVGVLLHAYDTERQALDEVRRASDHALTQVKADRDRAREVAIQLEQQNAALVHLFENMIDMTVGPNGVFGVHYRDRMRLLLDPDHMPTCPCTACRCEHAQKNDEAGRG